MRTLTGLVLIVLMALTSAMQSVPAPTGHHAMAVSSAPAGVDHEHSGDWAEDLLTVGHFHGGVPAFGPPVGEVMADLMFSRVFAPLPALPGATAGYASTPFRPPAI
ncbi:MAG: hypothetical protein H0W33_10405 [Gammaproteobacteria bacterium]|nr:hypothetical protein [Gammaproteobacteria bacterium]